MKSQLKHLGHSESFTQTVPHTHTNHKAPTTSTNGDADKVNQTPITGFKANTSAKWLGKTQKSFLKLGNSLLL